MVSFIDLVPLAFDVVVRYKFSLMSDYLKKPILTKDIEYTKGKGFALTSCEMQGWRKSM